MKNSLIIGLGLILIVLSLIFFKMYERENKVLYIDNTYVYNRFKMTLELQEELKGNKQLKENILDSLYQQLNSPSVYKTEAEMLTAKKSYLYKKNALIEDQATLKRSFEEKIWERLNFYIKEYGNLHHYQMILGANGQGNIMHAVEGLNISEEFLTYANAHYDGK